MPGKVTSSSMISGVVDAQRIMTGTGNHVDIFVLYSRCQKPVVTTYMGCRRDGVFVLLWRFFLGTFFISGKVTSECNVFRKR